jgi:Fe-S-cluster containining protein
MVSRQERRAVLKRSIDTVSRQGMDLAAPRSDRLWMVVAATRLLMDILGGKNPTRASDAAKRAHEFFEISLKRNPSDHVIECSRGCAFCCHLRVTAMAPEVFLLANHIRRNFKDDLKSVLGRVRATDENARGLSAKERARHQFPCGLLLDNACSVYSARPSSCRALTSISVNTCERGFNGETVQVLTPAVWTELRGAHNQAMWAALAASDLSSEGYELNHAVLVALETPDAERRWLAGEDIFAAVDCDKADDGERALKKRITDRLIAGALGKELPPWEGA